MPHLVISLNSDEGMMRRSALNFEHEIIEAIPAPSSFILQGRYKQHKDAILSGCYSHYRCWQELVRRGRSGVVLEDDAERVRHDIEYHVDTFPDDGFTLLGGAIRTPGAWEREQQEFVDTSQIMQIILGFSPGVNPVRDFRWTNSIAYFMPLKIAKKLIGIVDANPSFRIIDIWLSNLQVPQYLMWPNLFIDSERAISQLGSKDDHAHSDLYVCRFMREAMQRQGYTFPVRGGDWNAIWSPISMQPINASESSKKTKKKEEKPNKENEPVKEEAKSSSSSRQDACPWEQQRDAAMAYLRAGFLWLEDIVQDRPSIMPDGFQRLQEQMRSPIGFPGWEKRESKTDGLEPGLQSNAPLTSPAMSTTKRSLSSTSTSSCKRQKAKVIMT